MRSQVLAAGLVCLLGGCALSAETHGPSSSEAHDFSDAAGMAGEAAPSDEPAVGEPPPEHDAELEPPRDRRDIVEGQLDELEGSSCANGCALAGEGGEPAKPGEALCRAALDWGPPGWVNVGQNIVSDSHGNVFIAGKAAHDVTLGPFAMHATDRSVSFVVKLGPDCTPLERFELSPDAGSGLDIYALAIDRDDNLILVGELIGSADLGLGPIASGEIGSSGLVLKLSPDGTALWHRLLSSSYMLTRIYDADVSANGDLIVTGGSARDVRFEGFETSDDYNGAVRFIAYLSADGAEGPVYTLGNSEIITAVDASGRAALTGYAYGGYGTGPFAGLTWSPQIYDYYLLTLDPSGALEHFETLESVNEREVGSFGAALAFDHAGDLIVERGHSLYVEADDGFADQHQTLFKRAADGTLTWSLASHYEGTVPVFWLSDLTIDSHDNILHVDELAPGLTLEGADVQSHGPRDFLIRKRDATGALLWSTQLGSPGEDDLIGLTTDPSDAIWVALSTEEDNDVLKGTITITKLAP